MNIYPRLPNTTLFSGLDPEEIQGLFSPGGYTAREYTRDSMVVLENDECISIGMILEGMVEARKMYHSGRTVTLARIGEGEMFGEALVFSAENRYPATIIAVENTVVIYLGRETVTDLCNRSRKVLENFLGCLSRRLIMLNKKVMALSFKTIRQKICHYLLEVYSQQKSNMINLPVSRKDMAEFMGIQRPSLSREMMKMKEEGLIDFYRNSVKLLDIQLLEEELFR